MGEEKQKIEMDANTKEVIALSDGIAKDIMKPKIPDMDKWLDKAKELEVFYDSVVPEPETVLEISNSDGSTTVLGTLGNFSVVSGQEKAGKGFFISCCLASALGNIETIGCIRGTLPHDKPNAVLIDTEQGLWHVKNALHRIGKMSGAHPSNIRVISTRGETPEDSMKIIESIVCDDPKIGLVVIDGIADLMHDSNDIKEANKINAFLLKVTKDNHIHIITVVHTNPRGEKSRGHLGTELQRKSENRLFVENKNNENYFTVKTSKSRWIGLKTPIAFCIDSDGIPQGVEYDLSNKINEPQTSKITIDDDILIEIMKYAFKTDISKRGAVPHVSEKYNELLQTTISVSTIHKLINRAEQQRFVIKSDGKYVFNNDMDN